jgi:hypothetical protein
VICRDVRTGKRGWRDHSAADKTTPRVTARYGPLIHCDRPSLRGGRAERERCALTAGATNALLCHARKDRDPEWRGSGWRWR